MDSEKPSLARGAFAGLAFAASELRFCRLRQCECIRDNFARFREPSTPLIFGNLAFYRATLGLLKFFAKE